MSVLSDIARIYVRVSTEEQSKEGFSIEAQLRVLDAYAVVKGFAHVERYVDEGFSAKNLNRPAMSRLISDCADQPGGIVLVWKLDRLSRNLRDTLALVEDVFSANRVEFLSATESIDTTSASGRLMLNILSSVAQNEREVNEERVRMVCRDLAQKCVHLGGVPPYGYHVDANRLYEVVPDEADVVRMIYRLYASGLGYNTILSRLAEAGVRTRAGGFFTKPTLHDILLNEKYTGVYVYNRSAPASRAGSRNNHRSKPDDQIIRIPGGMPAIVDAQTWNEVQSRMKTSAHTGGRQNAKAPYIVSGLAFCGVCGRHLVAQVSGRDRDGTMQRRYVCPNKCIPRIRHEKLDAYVIDYVASLAQNEDLVRDAVTIANDFAAHENAERERSRAELSERLAAVNAEADNIISYIKTAGANAPASLIDALRSLDIERNNLQSALDDASVPRQIDPDQLLASIRRLSDIKSRTPEEQKKEIAQIVRRVDVFADHVNVYLDNPSHGGGDAIHSSQLSVMLTFFFARG
jgi:site-specific DNA recombinase